MSKRQIRANRADSNAQNPVALTLEREDKARDELLRIVFKPPACVPLVSIYTSTKIVQIVWPVTHNLQWRLFNSKYRECRRFVDLCAIYPHV